MRSHHKRADKKAAYKNFVVGGHNHIHHSCRRKSLPFVVGHKTLASLVVGKSDGCRVELVQIEVEPAGRSSVEQFELIAEVGNLSGL